MFKMVRWLLTLLCSCTMAVASNVSDDEVGRISQGIIDKYPNGWTCIRDMERFCWELNGWCPVPESLNSDYSGSEEEDTQRLSAEQRQSLSEITVNTLYERTKRALNGSNDSLLVSFLAFSEANNEKTQVFNNLLEQYLEEHHVKGPDKNKFLRDTLWATQLRGMQQSTAGRKHQDVSYDLIYMCISLSAEDEKFIYDEIVEKMVKYGFGSMVPYRYRRE